jgi:hypothetical protein
MNNQQLPIGARLTNKYSQIDVDCETWRSVPGYEGFYEVSSMGRVRSLPRKVKDSMGRVFPFPGRDLKAHVVKRTGRPQVLLAMNGSVATFLVHRLVMLAFVGPKPEGLETCHNDGDPANNCLSNLRYDTPSSNQMDRYKHGNMWVGEKCLASKLKDSQVLEIIRLSRNGKNPREISKHMGTCPSNVRCIVSGKTWKHISREVAK